jgi:hypothetical protein
MLVLGIETATPHGSVALEDASGLRGRISTAAGHTRHSRTLVPRLETLVVEVTNASGDELLVLEPREIYLDGVGPSVEPIGPPETLVLSPGETGVMAYDPGIRAPLLAYPFTLHVTVFRDRNLGRPRSATVLLY